MENNNYRVKILTPNTFIIHRGKKLRTPVECRNVCEKDLVNLKSQILRGSLKHTIQKENDDKDVIVMNPLVVEKNDGDIKVEELYDPENEPNSIMDRLISEEKKV
jgi:hypothetical protein